MCMLDGVYYIDYMYDLTEVKTFSKVSVTIVVVSNVDGLTLHACICVLDIGN